MICHLAVIFNHKILDSFQRKSGSCHFIESENENSLYKETDIVNLPFPEKFATNMYVAYIYVPFVGKDTKSVKRYQ